MDKLDAMLAFTKVVAHGGFAEAARQLGLTRSAVSKAVIELEHLLGTRLLDRTTRRVRPTEAGLAYYERSLAILTSVEESELQVASLQDKPRGVLKVNAPMSFGTLYLGNFIAAFMRKFPEVKVEMVLSDQVVDPIEGGFDVTLRIGRLENSSLVARKIAPVKRILVASPAYIAAHGEPVRPAELQTHRCLNYGHNTTSRFWQLTEANKVINVSIQSCLCSNNAEVLHMAAVDGIGITKLPTFIVGSSVRSGRLKMVLCDYPAVDLTMYALYAPNRNLPAKSRIFIDALVERFADERKWETLRSIRE